VATLTYAGTAPAEVRVVLTGFAPTDLATRGTVTFDDVGATERRAPGAPSEPVLAL
jgi:hypothetical protein